METNSMSTEKLYRSYLRGVKDDLNANCEMGQLVNSAWNFTYNSLWPATIFSPKEIAAAKGSIREYLTLAVSSRRAFISYCQRVLLARQFVSSSKERYIPFPSVWLNKNNPYGFAGTKVWFQEIKVVRDSLPAYKEEIRALAEAVLHISDEPTIENYQYWRQYFIERQASDLLNLFQVTVIQQLCNC